MSQLGSERTCSCRDELAHSSGSGVSQDLRRGTAVGPLGLCQPILPKGQWRLTRENHCTEALAESELNFPPLGPPPRGGVVENPVLELDNPLATRTVTRLGLFSAKWAAGRFQ